MYLYFKLILQNLKNQRFSLVIGLHYGMNLTKSEAHTHVITTLPGWTAWKWGRMHMSRPSIDDVNNYYLACVVPYQQHNPKRQ